MSEPMRQPLTVWQWLTSQPGTLFVPPPAPIYMKPEPKTALDVIDLELRRIHEEMESFQNGTHNSPAYSKLIESLDKLNVELIRRSAEESKH